MTPEQFEALAALAHLRQSASRDAARLVLVDGLSVIDAAARAGITQQGANQAVLRCRRSMELAKAACGEVYQEILMASSPAQMSNAAKVRWDVLAGKSSKIIQAPQRSNA